jgi:hypothetical protein
MGNILNAVTEKILHWCQSETWFHLEPIGIEDGCIWYSKYATLLLSFSRKCYPFKICLIRWTCMIKIEICKFFVFSLFSFLEYIQPCRMVGGNHYSGGMCCLHLKVTSMIKVPCAVVWETAHSFQKWQLSAKLQGITSQKAIIFPQHLSRSHNQVFYSCHLLSFTLVLSNQNLACISYFPLYKPHNFSY